MSLAHDAKTRRQTAAAHIFPKEKRKILLFTYIVTLFNVQKNATGHCLVINPMMSFSP